MGAVAQAAIRGDLQTLERKSSHSRRDYSPGDGHEGSLYPRADYEGVRWRGVSGWSDRGGRGFERQSRTDIPEQVAAQGRHIRGRLYSVPGRQARIQLG